MGLSVHEAFTSSSMGITTMMPLLEARTRGLFHLLGLLLVDMAWRLQPPYALAIIRRCGAGRTQPLLNAFGTWRSRRALRSSGINVFHTPMLGNAPVPCLLSPESGRFSLTSFGPGSTLRRRHGRSSMAASFLG